QKDFVGNKRKQHFAEDREQHEKCADRAGKNQVMDSLLPVPLYCSIFQTHGFGCGVSLFERRMPSTMPRLHGRPDCRGGLGRLRGAHPRGWEEACCSKEPQAAVQYPAKLRLRSLLPPPNTRGHPV